MAGVARELGAEPCTARQLVEAIVRLHPEYGVHGAPTVGDLVGAVAWPDGGRTETVHEWFRASRTQLVLGSAGELSGKLALVGLALVDRAVGRALVRCGLFATIVADLREGLDILNERGLSRLATIPLAAVGRTGAAVALPTGHGQGRGAVSSDGRLMARYDGSTVTVWDLATGLRCGRPLTTPGALSSPVVMARFATDRRELVGLLQDGRVVRWSLDGPAREPLVYAAPERVARGALSTDGRWAALRFVDAGVALVDTASGRRVTADTAPAQRIAIAADGSRVAVATEKGIEVFLRGDGPTLGGPVYVGAGPVGSLDVGPTLLVAVVDGQVRVFDARSGDERHAWSVGAHRVVLSPDEQVMALNDADGAVLWNPTTGAVLARLEGVGPGHRCTFSIDGRRLLATDPSGESAAVFDVGVDPPGGPPPAAIYDNDDAAAEADLLGRSRDTDALAALIASRAMRPPLSIGVFGNWGSGKSWFMRQVKRRVAALAADASASDAHQSAISFYKRIAQVEFNAWHYAEADVLTSMVEHIFNRLDLGDAPGYAESERLARLQAVARSERAVADAETGLSAERVERDRLRLELVELERQRDRRAQELVAERGKAEALQVAATTARGVLRDLGLGAAMQTVDDLRGALREADTAVHGGASVLTPLVVGAPSAVRRRRAIAVGLAMFGPLLGVLAAVVVRLVRRDDDALAALSGAGATVVGVGTAVAGALQGGARWMRATAARVTAAADALDAAVAAELAPHEAAIAGVQARLAAQDDKVAVSARAEDDARQLLEQRLEAYRQARPEHMLEDLVSARVRSGDYAKGLGLVSQARRDFEKVSDLVSALNRALENPAADEGAVKVNRIVLYIDDLDRCEPDKVAEVLQAVHLLLAFPLFVVVVGVDARWVSRALQRHYPELLDGAGAGPLDYLEKIFQIPFWLESLTPASTTTMLQGLARVSAPTFTPVVAPSPTATEPPSLSGPASDASDVSTGPAPAALADVVARSRELNPPGLGIEAHELTAMAALAERLDRSPRALKRFVNLYRLLKVRADDPLDFADPDRDDADYRAVLFLLAELTGQPERATDFVRLVRAAHPGHPLNGTAGSLDHRLAVPEGWPDRADQYLRLVDDVARFSFAGARTEENGGAHPAAPAPPAVDRAPEAKMSSGSEPSTAEFA